jgi:hypothetical protein
MNLSFGAGRGAGAIWYSSLMILRTPPLSVKTVTVHPLLFKAQLPDTLRDLRQAIPEWTAVHVVSSAPPGGRGASPQEIQVDLLKELSPLAMPMDPIYTLSKPEIPPNTVCTLVPDRVRPSFAPEYEHWKYVYLKEARALLGELFNRALGGMPEGPVGPADALVKGALQGQSVLEGWTGSVGVPGFKRTMEAILDPAGRVMYWDSAFGFEGKGELVLRTADLVLGLFGSKEDRLYFDAANFSWFAVFYPGGQMRVGMLG